MPTNVQESAYAKDIALTVSALSISKGNLIAYYDVKETEYLVDITENIIVVTSGVGRASIRLNTFPPVSIVPSNIRGSTRFTYQLLNNEISFNNVRDYLEADVCLQKPRDLTDINFKIISDDALNQLKQDITIRIQSIENINVQDQDYLFELELLKEEGINDIKIIYPTTQNELIEKIVCYLNINKKPKILIKQEQISGLRIIFPEDKVSLETFDEINNLLVNSIRGNIIR